MRPKCYFQDVGFCKYDAGCRFQHSEGVCQERHCRTRNCSKRHPRPCRDYFLSKSCRFGKDCMFSHIFYCEDCDNFKSLINKEMKKVTIIEKVKDDIIENMKKDISEAKAEILTFRREKKKSENKSAN